MHILIVEDEQGLRENLCERLRSEGHVVEVAADGEEGLYYGQEYPLDLAVIDIEEVLDWTESNLTSFSLNNMPDSLGILPAESIYDYNSLNYMRSHSEIARKARIFAYKLFGGPAEIPNNDNRNSSTII